MPRAGAVHYIKSSHGDVAHNWCTPTVGTASRNRLGSPLVRMALLEGQGPSARHEVFYFGGAELGAVRVGDMKFIFYQQPAGWSGPKMPRSSKHPSSSAPRLCQAKPARPAPPGSTATSSLLAGLGGSLRGSNWPDGGRLSANAGPFKLEAVKQQIKSLRARDGK